MSELLSKHEKTVRQLAVLLCGLVLVGYIIAVYLAGGSISGYALYAIAFLFLVLLPGLSLCKLLLPGISRAARPVVSAAFGGAVLVLSFVICSALGMFYAAVIPPLLLDGYLFFQKHKKESTNAKLTDAPPRSIYAYGLLILFAVVLFLLIFTGVFNSAWPSAVGGMQYNQDALWGVGSAASPWYGFPVRDLRVANGIFHYHYFSDVLAGTVAVFTGQHTWNVNFFYLRPLWTWLMLLGSYAVSRNAGAKGWQALVVPLGVSVAWFQNYAAMFYVLNNPNNVIQSYVFILAAVLVLQYAQEHAFKGKTIVPAIGIAFMVVVWSKGSVGVLIIIAAAMAWLVYGVLHKQGNPLLLAGIGIGGIAAAVLLTFLFSGANINLYLELSVARVTEVLLTILKENGPLLILYAITLLYALLHFKKLTFTQLTLHATVWGGILANCMFNHYGGADTYFMLVALFAMWLCVGAMLPVLCSKKSGQALVAVLCTIAVAGNLLIAAPLLRHGVQAGMRCIGIRPAFEVTYDTLTPDDEAAALWLRENMTQTDVFATNRNERSLTNKDGVFLGYTALTGRQAYVEGWFYAMEYSIDYYQLRFQLEEVSDVLFACETYEEACAIARENGITYIMLHIPTKGKPFVGGTPVFTSDTVYIYKVSE